MKLHLDKSPALNTVTAYERSFIEINAQRYDHSLLVMPEGPVQRWALDSFSQLADEHFRAMLGQKPELVVVGTGERQRFGHPRLWQCLAEQHIGVEFMDTGAACRTYNILMTEGRLVLAAMVIERA